MFRNMLLLFLCCANVALNGHVLLRLFTLLNFLERPYKRHHTCKDESDACCLGSYTSTQREEILSEYPKEVQKQNQFVLNLINQFGDSLANTEEALEHIEFTILGRTLCETCLCILLDFSEWRYERIKNFYRVGAKVITHGNAFRHHYKAEKTCMAEAWLTNYCECYSEPMPHADIFHLHVPTKKSVFEEKPGYVQVPNSSLYKFWNDKVKVPTKNQIFARCPQCQGLRKRCFEAGKCQPALEALKDERKKHKEMYMTEKRHYYERQTKSVNQPHEMLCLIYDGMHKEKTRLPRFCKNPSKDLESVVRVPCNLLGFISHRQGLTLQPKEGYAFLNMFYPDNADFILSCLVNLLGNTELVPFPQNLSNQFDNASNNKCNGAIGFFAYLVSEGIFHNVYGNTLIVNHTHEDVDRMFENANEKFKRADMVTPNDVSALMKEVPYVVDVKQVPCVWDINNFLAPFLRTVHDFANVHHFWLHKNREGNVVLHYKRYATDKWLPDADDASTFLVDEDKFGILVFKEKPHGEPQLSMPVFPFSGQELEALKTSTSKLLKHPLLQDEKLEERRIWWTDYLAGNAFASTNPTWPLEKLKQKRKEQDWMNEEAAKEVVSGLEHQEEAMPMVYSGHYLAPNERERQRLENECRDNGEWPIKKVLKERINPRMHSKEYLVEWKPSWVPEKDLSQQCKEAWEAKRKRKNK